MIIDGVEYCKKEDIEYFLGKAIKEDLKDCENNEIKDGMERAVLSMQRALRQLYHVNLPVEILNDDEKRYIKNLVKPFRNKIAYIKKYTDDRTEYIEIEVNGKDGYDEDIYLPEFPINSMYKGMKSHKEYTLEELGITFKE